MASTHLPRRRLTALAAATSVAALTLGLAACTSDGTAETAEDTATDTAAEASATRETPSTPATSGSTSPTETDADQRDIDDLQFTLEEERMARDLYTALGEKWGSQPFLNIAPAEQRHMDAVVTEVERLGQPTDSADAEPGTFAIGEIQDLYDEWLERGSSSESEALVVGAELERRDIEDLERFAERTDDPDLKETYEYLLMGSRNHLTAFENAGGGAGQGGRGPRAGR